MCCGVVPILFGWFLRVPSLHVLVFIRKTFCDLFLLLFFILFFLEIVGEKRSRQGEDAWSVGYETWNCVVHKEQIIIINSNASK